MSQLEQAREAWERTIKENEVRIEIERKSTKPDGFGGIVEDPFGTVTKYNARVRITHESAATDGPGPGGQAELLGRFITFDRKTQIYRGDVFEALQNRWKVGIVDKITRYGGIIGQRAPITAIIGMEAST